MKQYVLCVSNKGYEYDLVVRKVYEVIPDPAGEEVGMVRVVDETGEDYLFESSRFLPVEVPKEAEPLFAVPVR